MHIRLTRPAAVAAVPLLGLALLAAPALGQAPDPVGTWNLQTRNTAERATGGVRNVILRVERAGDSYVAQMTSPRSTFLDVDEFSYDNGTLVVIFGAYEYALTLGQQGEEMTGTMTSPTHTLEVSGRRQDGIMYGGDDPAQYVATRTGVLGHRSALLPPEGEADPVGWVKSRIESVDDIALVLRGIPVAFTNPAEFEAQLLELAGQRVDVTGEWIGEKYKIHGIALSTSEGR